jgi:enoyl-CoA hydratase/carnithine racemase
MDGLGLPPICIDFMAHTRYFFAAIQNRDRPFQKGSTTMDENHVLYRKEGGIAVITLNRPEAKNAFSPEMISLWEAYLKEAKGDDSVRVIVVTGNGDTFCSGGDIRDMAEGKLRSWDMKNFLWEGVHRIVLTMEDLDKPVIAAINGAAMGAGMDMAIMCDLRVCSDRAKLAESYIMMGLIPGDGGAYFLPRLVGTSKALELLLTGDVLTAQDALSLGIVNKVVPHESLMEETMKLAAKIAGKPPLAVRMMKRAVHQAQTSTLRAHLDYISSQLSLLSETEDHREAALSFLEKRKPVFKGK